MWRHRFQGLQRAAVVVLAVVLATFTWSLSRPRLQRVQVESQGRSQQFLLPVDSMELRRLRAEQSRRVERESLWKPDQYYGAQWKLIAATHYKQLAIDRHQHALALQRTNPDGNLSGSILQAKYQQVDPREYDQEIPRWEQQRKAAMVEFEAIALSLQNARLRHASTPMFQFSGTQLNFPHSSQVLGVFALAGLMGWSTFSLQRKVSDYSRKAAIVGNVQLWREICAPATTYEIVPSLPQRALNLLYQIAWLVCGFAVAAIAAISLRG